LATAGAANQQENAGDTDEQMQSLGHSLRTVRRSLGDGSQKPNSGGGGNGLIWASVRECPRVAKD
jgi:hypothetical protein